MTKRIDPAAARYFLDRLGHDLYTISCITESGHKPFSHDLRNFKSGKYAKAAGKEKPMTAVSVSPDEFEDRHFIIQLAKLNKRRKAIYCLINESDGKVTDAEPNPTKGSNIVQLNACFADTDNCPAKKFVSWIREKKLRPHIVVESSPKKYHFYFLLEYTSVADSDRWKAVQESMAWLGNPRVDTGMDKTMQDINQLMRLPGFYHGKHKTMHFVRIINESFHQPYSLTELYDKLGAEKFYVERGDYVKYERPTVKVAEGQRHREINRFALSIANKHVGGPDMFQDVLDAVDGHIQKTFEKPYPFLLGGKRRAETVRTVQDCINRVDQEQMKDLPDFAEIEIKNMSNDSFSLPAEFYYDCPGIVGEMVKEICKNSLYPVPSFAFANAVAMLGTIKAPYTTSSRKHAPCNYFLCLAPSGAGKNYPQEVASNTFAELDLSRYMTNRIRSARGMEVFLDNPSYSGFVAMDEGEQFFASLTDKNTPLWMKQTRDLLLELYSKTKTKNFDSGYVGEKKAKPIVLHYPRLSFVAHGVVRSLTDAFTMESIEDGLLQRFIVLTHYGNKLLCEDAKQAASLNGSIFSALQELVTEGKLFTESKMEEISTLQLELEEAEGKGEIGRINRELKELQEQRYTIESKIIPFTTKASDEYKKYQRKMLDRENDELKKDSGFSGLYTRAAEQVGRLATAIATDRIDSKLLNYLIYLVDTRVAALHTYCQAGLNVSSYSKKQDKMFNKIAARYNETKEPVTISWLRRNHRGVKNSQEFKGLLEGLYESGRIVQASPPVKGGRGNKGETFYPQGLFEEEI